MTHLPAPEALSPTIRLYHGDCLEVLKGLPDQSVDSIVTDPPYGLSGGSSKGLTDRLGDVLFDVVLPDLYNANASLGRIGEFSGPTESPSFLDFVLRSFGKESRIAVPESAVNLKGHSVGKHEVEDVAVGTIEATDNDLSRVGNADAVEFGGDFILQLRPCWHSSFRDGARRLFRLLGSGRIGVPVVIAKDSEFARFLRTATPSGPSFLADLIRLQDGSAGEASGTSGVVAWSGAEVRAVLAFNLSGGFLEILPAVGTDDCDAAFEVCMAEPVRANSRACSLPAMFEPRRFGLIGDSTRRAVAFHFHKAFLREIDSTRGGFMGKTWDSEIPSIEVWKECLRVLKPGGYMLTFGGTRTYHRMAVNIEDAGFELRDTLMWVFGSGFPKSKNLDGDWNGWGTALKPAFEPITLARKPLEGTVAANVLQHGVGGINIDATRVPLDGDYKCKANGRPSQTGLGDNYDPAAANLPDSVGRWPANLLHDGSDEVLAHFPTAPGQIADVSQQSTSRKNQNCYGAMARSNGRDGEASADSENAGAVGFAMRPGARRLDAGSAARFFYCTKATRADRNDGCDDLDARSINWSSGDANPGSFQAEGTDRTSRNNHPTVKSTTLMRWLVRLITPPGGTVLDCFAGSGSTGRAAALEGMAAILVEREAEYLPIIRRRVAAAIATASTPAVKPGRKSRPKPTTLASSPVGLFDNVPA